VVLKSAVLKSAVLNEHRIVKKHLVLLRGLAREAAHWMDFPQQLAQKLGSDWTIHCIDFPGCGSQFQQPALASIQQMTDYARAQISGRNDRAELGPAISARAHQHSSD
jgi:pimeloyl-ACP methyl ester carboxylesterase